MINAYAELTDKTARYPEANTGNKLELMYLSLGLVCEAGEVGNKVKCFFFDSNNEAPEDRKNVLKECGQAMWYLTRLIRVLGGTPEEVIKQNIEEITSNNNALEKKREFYSR